MMLNRRQSSNFYSTKGDTGMLSRAFSSLFWVAVLGCALFVVAGCLGSRDAQEVPPDERFGHRYETEGPDGRRTLSIIPPDSALTYFYYPATFDTVVVRPSPFAADVPAETQQVEVEILVKGAFPDACSELHGIQQERAGNIINATLEMRKPEGSICASVRRPYRFYVMLEGRYGLGAYTLKLNDEVVPFEIRAPRSQSR